MASRIGIRMKPAATSPLLLAGSYLAFSTLWILFSDQLLASLGLDAAQWQRLQTWKGLLFITLSSLLVFGLARYQQRHREQLLDNLLRERASRRNTQREADLGDWQFRDSQFWLGEQAIELLQLPSQRQRLTQEQLLQCLHPADRVLLQNALQALLGEGKALNCSVRLQPRDNGELTWLQLRGQALGPFCAEGSVRNITAQKRDEQALRESERRFRQLFEQTPRIAVQGYDRERRVIYWNQASSELYGYSASEAMGRHLEQLIVPTPMRSKVVADIQRWMSGGEPIAAGEITLQRRDGSPVYVYSSHQMLVNLHNQPELYCIDIDLSDQRSAQAALKDSEARYRELIEQLSEAIFLLDDQGRLSFLSQAWWALSGHSAEQSLHQPLEDFLHDEDSRTLCEIRRQLSAGKRASWTGEYRLRCSDGSLRWVEVQLKRSAQGMRGSLTDIHSRRQIQALQQARNAVLDALNGNQPLADILTGIAYSLERVNPQMRVSILLLDGEGQQLHLLAAPSLPDEWQRFLRQLAVPDSLISCAQAVRSGELVVLDDLQGAHNDAALRQLCTQAGIAAAWSLPFKDEFQQVLGVFGIYYQQRRQPSQEDLDLVTEFSRLAALAVQQQMLQQQRQESEQRFRATFEHAAIGIAHVALDGQWLRVNRHLCEMFGYAEEQLLQRTFQELSHTDDLPRDLHEVQRLLQGERNSYSLEKRYWHASGRLVWAHLSVVLVRHANGQPHYFISVLEDISMRKQHEAALRQAATVFDSSREAILIVDQQRRIITSNPAFSELTGLAPETALGRHLPLALHNAEQRQRYRQLWRTLRDHGQWQGELFSRHPDGRLLPVLLNASLIRGGTAQERQYVLIFSDISALKDSQERLTHMAHFDPLTELPNRLLAHERLKHALLHAQRNDARVAVLFFDLDHFKNINDSLGHPAGDELLGALAQRLRQRLRQEDTLARLGGDEFLVILENLEKPDEAAQVARLLLRLIEAPFQLSGAREVYLTSSIGISLCPEDSFDADELIRNADAAMYQAKQSGRNTFCFYTQALTDAAQQRLILESRLRRALKQGEFILHYQPLLDTQSGRGMGVEALLRWQSSEGLVPPGQFIPLAEDCGLIEPLGAWALQEACRQAQQWRQQGLNLQTLAVNLSPRQFRQRNLLEQVQRALRQSGLPARCLELEITEGALMDNVEQAQRTLQALRDLGLQLAVDDFGTGYSSLAYLRRFPINKLKIDQSFMQGIPEDHGNLQIVRAIITLAHSLDLNVLAEGVEQPQQLEVLRQLDCQYSQGYLFSRPLPADCLPTWWHEHGLPASMP